MAEPFLGEIRQFSFGVIPNGWSPCNGQILLIHENSALFSVIGFTYGGDRKLTFALPNLQGRVPIHCQTFDSIGTLSGEATHSLTLNEIPSHTHRIIADSANADKLTPLDAVWGSVENVNIYAEVANVNMNSNALSPTGQGLAHNNMQPSLALSFCIAIQGVYPTRY